MREPIISNPDWPGQKDKTERGVKSVCRARREPSLIINHLVLRIAKYCGRYKRCTEEYAMLKEEGSAGESSATHDLMLLALSWYVLCSFPGTNLEGSLYRPRKFQVLS